MDNRIYLSSPHMGETEQTYVSKAFETNWIAPLGPNVQEFEIAIEDYLGNKKNVAALSSGTAALHLALILLGVSSGDEVLCQSMTFSASANPIVYQGATPVFVDSEHTTWNMCPDLLEEAIRDRIKKGKKPKAIIAVHLYGMPYQVEKLQAVAEKHGIPIVEDSAEALGSTYKGKMCGTFGTYAILSFNGNKIITTSGGGALVAPTLALKQRAVFLATQARDEAPHYQHSNIGYNYRLSNICAGIGRGQMEVLPERISQRRKNNSRYAEIFRNVEGVSVFTEPDGDYFSNHWLSCIQIDKNKTGFTPEKLRLALEAENIESRPLWKPMHLQPVFKDAPAYTNGISEEIFSKGLCLPSGSNLTAKDWERIKIVLGQFV
ncbi:DegT/DnrJ/EryC1/StrS family aminotransferase [Marinirhabdus gelatinilytica]|uniref:dTDP-4-amino-4,6-dideoxygalactose transaminase n=1 Tax=Marinirhabdus gelatinilytica TaxID=1703343 RepID=A0A370QG42_9FLAO|nr:aminotransferase class I/II-fold pyridoxal phosphate-dependent enzyme [Marinirhabdus gelatinilytica]RDK87336.1 dTDP-4-amino-4,6-dideoxygalactose transaminase [Marinirhabdus gelatinilytica]